MAERKVLITGGATGIGKAAAHFFAKKGFQLFINYRSSKNEAEGLIQYLKEEYGIRANAIEGDIAYFEDCMKISKKIKTIAGGIDILIHNAGPFIHGKKKLSEYKMQEWDYLINGNLNSVFYLSQMFLPYMQKQRWGRIITLGFDKAETAPGWPFRGAFAAAKSGLVSLTKTLSMEEAGNGITVNMVCPGDIDGKWKEKTIEDASASKDEPAPVGRTGSGEDIARVIGFLCEDRSDFITGTVIHVHGGKDVLSKSIKQLERLSSQGKLN